MKKIVIVSLFLLILPNIPASNAIAVHVDILDPPNNTVFHHRNVSIYCKATSCCQDLLVYWEWTWKWSNGSYSESGWINYTPVYRFYINISLYPGENEVIVVVKSNRDISASDDITLYYDGPLANANGPYYGKSRQIIQFNGTAYGGDKPYTWLWDFGDGNISHERNPRHAYALAGKYRVNLTVTDNNGYKDTAITWSFIEADNMPPTVEIVTPKYGIYINGKKIFPSPITVVIGKIDVRAEANDNDTGISSVAFYVDNEFKANVTSPPYTWFMYESMGSHQIKVIAYDTVMNTAEDEINIMVVTKKFKA